MYRIPNALNSSHKRRKRGWQFPLYVSHLRASHKQQEQGVHSLFVVPGIPYYNSNSNNNDNNNIVIIIIIIKTAAAATMPFVLLC